MKEGYTTNGVKRVASGGVPMTDREQLVRLLDLAQEMGSPLNVVHGRMEYLLDRKLDRETRRSLTAIMAQAKQLIALRQQLIDEVRTVCEQCISPQLNGTIGSD